MRGIEQWGTAVRGGALRLLTALTNRIHRTVRGICSFLCYAGLRFYNDNCFQTASSLTYTALLAMVPLMTIGFAIFTAFPAFHRLRNEAQDLLFTNLVPEVGSAVRDYLGGFMENAGQSTAFGVVGLAISAVLLLSTIEGAFGAIWRVNEPRPLITRFLSFWALLTLAPLLFGASLSVSSTVFANFQGSKMEAMTAPFHGFGVIAPGCVEFIGFTLVYIILPNRAVGWLDAARGGAFAAVLLELSKAGFAWYLRAFPAYQTIYGALSTVPIFLLWLYIAWSTVLFGAVIAASLPEWRAGKISRNGLGGLLPGPRLAVALGVLGELLVSSREGGGLRRKQLVDQIPVGEVLIEGILEQLREADWVARTTRDTWVLTRDLAVATLYDLERSLGIGLVGSIRDVAGLEMPWRERCAGLLEAAESSSHDLLGIPLRDLLSPSPEPTEGGGAVPFRAGARR
ncbi:MAG: YihY family inner membrane protein [Azospirillum sp.]|nr:YihY family inner membrane protein [Azospirillum sp.]